MPTFAYFFRLNAFFQTQTAQHFFMAFSKKISFLLGCLLFLLSACESADEKIARRAKSAAEIPSAKTTPDGMAIFRKYCIACHGADGTLGLNGAKDFRQSTLTLEERIDVITHGRKLMTPFGEMLSPQEIKAVAEY